MIQTRPSMRAAVDQGVKVLGLFATLLVPVAIGLLAQGRPAAAIATLIAGQVTSLYPAMIAAALPALRLYFTRYAIDDDGVRVTTNLLAKSDQRIPWEKVTAIRHRRTVLDAILGITRVDVIAYGRRGATLHLVGLQDGRGVRQEVARRMRSACSVDALTGRDD